MVPRTHNPRVNPRKRHLDQYSRFCTARHVRNTQTCTDHAKSDICNNRPHLMHCVKHTRQDRRRGLESMQNARPNWQTIVWDVDSEVIRKTRWCKIVSSADTRCEAIHPLCRLLLPSRRLECSLGGAIGMHCKS